MAHTERTVDPAVRLALLDAVLGSVPIGLAVIDREMRYLVVSDALAAMNGITPEAHLGRTVAEVLGPDVPVLSAIEQVLGTGEAVVGLDVEAAAPSLPEVVRRFSASFHPIRDGGAAVTAVAAIVMELTEQDRVTEVLRASERRYRTLVEATTSLVWQVRPGESPHLEWQQRIHPDDRDRISDAWVKAVESGTVFDEECRVVVGDEVHHALVRAVPLVEGGTVREWIGATTDVTATRRAQEALATSEARFRLSLASGRTGTWDWDLLTGRIDWSDETFDIYAVPPEQFDHSWESFARHVHPDDLRAVQEQLERVIPGLGAFEHEMRVNRPDGSTAHVLSRGQTFPGPDGTPARMVGVAIDVTEQRRDAERVVQILETIPDGFYAMDRDWCFTFMNAKAEQILGRGRDVLLGTSIWESFPDLLGTEIERAYRRAVERNEVLEADARYPGSDMWLAVRAYPTAEGLSVYFRDVSAQRAAEDERARLERLREAAAERTARLGEVAAALTEVTALGDVARLVLLHGIRAVEARGGALALFDADGQLRWTAIEGYPSEMAARLVASPLDADRPVTRVVASRLPEFITTPEELASEYPAIAPVFASLGDEALCCLPLVAGGRCLGAVTLTFDRARTFGVEDRLLLAALTDLSAQALERARLFEREHRVAETLQRALLPDRLATPGRLEAAARYLPGTEGVQVGGDWFDVFELDEHRVGIVLGDVAGKGVGAAAVMGRLRNALRAFATSIDSPAAALTRLDEFAARFGEDDLATLVYGVLDTNSGELRLSSAGHLPPLTIGFEGLPVFLVRDPDLPVGVAAGDERREHRVRLRAGDSLVLYSDGLVEDRARGIDDGLDALAAAAGRLHTGDVETLCSSLVRTMVGDAGGDDDVAVLVLRWAGPPADDRCSVVLPPEVASARRARALVTEELQRWGEPDLVETATLCASEIVTNAVVHAGTPVTLDIQLLPDRVRVEVCDGGAAPPERVEAQFDDVHGRGVAIVELLSTGWGVQPRTGGKCVWFELLRGEAHAAVEA